MNAFRAWLSQLQFDGVWQTALLVCACLLCITFHEACHGFAAYRLGDPTAKRAGRLTLNPFRHIDLSGLLMMALVRFGWAKPVPVDMRYFRHPKQGMAITALAGPLANVVLAYLGVVFSGVCSVLFSLYAGRIWYVLMVFFFYLQTISAGLAVFNIFPLPPLDGSKILFSFLPDKAYGKLMRYERYGMVLLMILLLTGVLDVPLTFLRDGLLQLLTAAGAWPARLLWNALQSSI